MKRLINRINKLYYQATKEQHNNNVNWYAVANYHAQKLSDKFNVDMFIVVGVLAALSPNNKWQRNLIDAELFLEKPSLTTKVCTFFGQRHKALAIMQAKDVQEVRQILGGQKTQNFYENILFPHYSYAVTVDTWMYRAAKLPPSKKNFELIANAVTEAARQQQLMPHQYQAVVWSVIRTTKEKIV